MAPAGRAPGVRAGRRARPKRSAHASDAAVGGASRTGRRHEGAAAVTSVTGRRTASAAGQLGLLRRRCDGPAAALRPVPTRQTGRGEPWATWAQGTSSAAAAAAASSRATALHVATRKRMRRFLCVARTSWGQPQRAPETSAMVPMAAATVPGARAVARKPPARSVVRVEVPEAQIEPDSQRAARSGGAGRGPKFELSRRMRTV